MAAKRIYDRLVFYPGDVIFTEGEEGNWAYLIQTGSVEIYKTMPDGSEHVIAALPSGRLFGEMALIDSMPRMASVRATSVTTVIVINNDILQASLKNAHPLVFELIRNLSNNLRSTVREQVKKKKKGGKDEEEGPRPYPAKMMT